MAITGLPPRREPLEQSFLCPECSRRYLVFTGGGSPFEARAFEAARERAGQMRAYFVDARQVRVLNCLDCSYVFDLSPASASDLIQ